MVTYSAEALLDILGTISAINGRPTFKGLWDMVGVLLPKLRTIKHPNHPTEGMTGMMMTPATFVLVSTMLWQLPERVGEVFSVPRWAIPDTDQQTEERK